MAISNARFPSSIQTFYGLSTGTKPTSTQAHFGDLFYEIDTSDTYIWNSTAWVDYFQKISIDQTSPGITNLVQVEGKSKSTYVTTALTNSGIIKAGAGILYGLIGTTNSTLDQWIMIFDSATVPANGAIPLFPLASQSLSNFSLDYGIYGFPFVNGLSWSNSSTINTKTISGNNCWISAIYH